MSIEMAVCSVKLNIGSILELFKPNLLLSLCLYTFLKSLHYTPSLLLNAYYLLQVYCLSVPIDILLHDYKLMTIFH